MRAFVVTPIVEQEQGYDRRVVLPIQYKLGIQARQSKKAQTENNRESYDYQTNKQLSRAIRMGWKDDGGIIKFIENKRKDGKIVDASGTKRIDQRPLLQDMIGYIEKDSIKAVMTRGVDRLFRHADMIEPAVFAKICKEHRCIVITDSYTFDFYNHPDDTKKFLADAQAGADYITNHVGMMLRYKREKALRGEYDGRNVPIEFILDEWRERYVIYEPQARVVRWLFRRYRELGGNFAALKHAVLQKMEEQGYLFPPFPDGMQPSRSTIGQNEHGYTLTTRGLRDILTNVAYIGWWLVYETIDKGKETEQKVLRAKIEDNHPAIVDETDFWYAYEKLTAEGSEQMKTRARHTKVGTISCNALLEGIVTSPPHKVYVYQNATQPAQALYTIVNAHEYYTDRAYGSIYVATLDRLFVAHLLEKIEEEQRQQEAFETDYFNREDFDTLEVPQDRLTRLFLSLLNAQQESTAGMQTQIAEYTEEADSLEKTLHFGASKLTGETIEKFSTRLTHLQTTLGELNKEIKKAEKEQEELLEFADEVGDVPENWHKLGIEKQRRFVRLATRKIVLSKPAPNWLQLEITWLWTDELHSVCYIWQRKGQGEVWTGQENRTLHLLYPNTDRATVLAALPARNWSAIITQAMHKGIARTYQYNNSPLHKIVSVDDDRYMREHGIEFDAENPGVRAWWKTVIQSKESLSMPDSSQ